MAKANTTKTPKPAKAKKTPELHTDKANAVADTANAPAEGKTSKSIVRLAYKEKYGQAQGCGDDVARELTAATLGSDEKGRPVTNMDELHKIALKNGISQAVLDGYKRLNIGQQRMNIGNRLRAMVKRGEKVVIGKRVFDAAEANVQKKAKAA